MRKLMLVCLVMLAIVSCESPSSRRAAAVRYGTTTNAATTNGVSEKVVIIRVEPFIATTDGQAITYKIKRPEKGVVQFIRLYNQISVLSVGDTIFHKF